MLLRQGIVWSGGTAWTGRHELWLRQQKFDLPGRQLAFDADFEAVLLAGARRDRLDEAIAAMAAGSDYTPVVRRLSCLRGVSTLTAFGLAVEIGDWHRFTGSTIGAYLGLVPTERSSGGSPSQGSITKTGNTHARRLLVEAAWHHRKTHRNPSLIMQARWALASPAAAARGYHGNHRLHSRWEAYNARSKKPVVANVAIARPAESSSRTARPAVNQPAHISLTRASRMTRSRPRPPPGPQQRKAPGIRDSGRHSRLRT